MWDTPGSMIRHWTALTPSFRYLVMGCASAILLCLVLLLTRRYEPPEVVEPEPPAAEVTVDPLAPVRAVPERFPRGTYKPAMRESEASGSVDLGSFSAGRDLIYFDDKRVWWESDNDTGDTEDDHSIHRSVEWPLRRLIEMVCERDGILEFHEAYRPTGIHNPRSLHQEGRAIDVTCDEMTLEQLAGLCYAAGFDWVLYEKGRGGNGDHIHCSVRRDRKDEGQDEGG